MKALKRNRVRKNFMMDLRESNKSVIQSFECRETLGDGGIKQGNIVH